MGLGCGVIPVVFGERQGGCRQRVSTASFAPAFLGLVELSVQQGVDRFPEHQPELEPTDITPIVATTTTTRDNTTTMPCYTYYGHKKEIETRIVLSCEWLHENPTGKVTEAAWHFAVPY